MLCTTPAQLQPQTTGVLLQQPLLARGRAYCGVDFRRRAVAWYVSEQEALGGRTTKRKGAKRTKAKTVKTPTPPSRVQPARAAKKRKSYAEDDDDDDDNDNDSDEMEHAMVKRRRCGVSDRLHDNTNTPGWDSVLQKMGAEAFLQALDALLDQTIARLVASAAAATTAQCSAGWCPVVAQPLACTERAYCLHDGIGRTDGTTADERRPPARAPEAPMEAPQAADAVAEWGWACAVAGRRDGQAGLACGHVMDQTVRLGGLRFAVDICSGTVQIWVW